MNQPSYFDYELKRIKNLALGRLHRQKPLKEYVALQLLN